MLVKKTIFKIGVREMSNALISVIVPVYNVEKYVEKCLRSLLTQSYENIEIIIVSDGSQDGSDAICKRYADAYPQIRYYRTENHGVSAARNYGLRKAEGEYCMLVDSDDYLDADAIARMAEVMEREDADIVQCAYRMEIGPFSLYRRAPGHKVMSPRQALHALMKNVQVNNYPWGKLYRIALFREISFPTQLSIFEDVCTIFQLFMKAERIVTIPDRFYHYVQRKGSFMNKNGVFTMDMDTLMQMHTAFEFQEQVLNEAYPDEAYSNHQNYFCVSMLVLYTMIFFIRRKDISKHPLPFLDLEAQPLLCRIIYRFCRAVARVKFGDRLIEERPLKKAAKEQKSAVSG